MQIAFRELSLRSLDALSADALALFINQSERPLQGLAGLCDWRLCGQLSRVLQAEFFTGKGGEALLMPAGHRLRVGRLLVFGLGESGTATEAQAARAVDAAARAGARSLAMAIGPLGDTPEAAAQVWLRISRGSALERQILIGEVRELSRVVRDAIGEGRSFQLEGEAALAPATPRLQQW